MPGIWLPERGAQGTGRSREAEETLEAAVVAGREEVRLKPDSAIAHAILGNALL